MNLHLLFIQESGLTHRLAEASIMTNLRSPSIAGQIRIIGDGSNYWRWVLSGSLTYSTKSAWDFSFSGAHYRFNGYEEGFGDPYTELDVTIKKNIKDWSLTFFVNDLLGQSRFYFNRATENSVVTTYHNSLGRYFMLSFSWHFGKSGSKQASRAKDAQWNMIW